MGKIRVKKSLLAEGLATQIFNPDLWVDTLSWCPSQCSMDFGRFEILLRWRHCDPWEAYLIDKSNDDWYDLDVGVFLQDCDLSLLKKTALKLAMLMTLNVVFEEYRWK